MTEYFNHRLGRWIVTLDDGRRTYRYRHVMEQHLGRRLARNEYVHHLNGDSADDRFENLVVVTGKQHAEYHAAQHLEWAHRGWRYEWSRDHPHCSECGTTERKHAGTGLCTRCYFRERSRRAYGHSPRRPATVIVATCPVCGTEFARTLHEGRRTYCSKKCTGVGMAPQIWATRRVNGTDRGYKKRKAAA